MKKLLLVLILCVLVVFAGLLVKDYYKKEIDKFAVKARWIMFCQRMGAQDIDNKL